MGVDGGIRLPKVRCGRAAGPSADPLRDWASPRPAARLRSPQLFWFYLFMLLALHNNRATAELCHLLLCGGLGF